MTIKFIQKHYMSISNLDKICLNSKELAVQTAMDSLSIMFNLLDMEPRRILLSMVDSKDLVLEEDGEFLTTFLDGGVKDLKLDQVVCITVGGKKLR